MPFAVAVYLVITEPSLELGSVVEYYRAFTLHLVLFERPKVLEVISCQSSDPVSFALSEEALIELFGHQLQSAFTLHFSIFEFSSINSTIGKELLSFSLMMNNLP